MKRTILVSITALVVLAAVAAMMSCSERINSNRKDIGIIGLSAQIVSPQTQDSMYFRLRVEGPDWRLEPPLILTDSAGWLVGSIDVPAGRGRIFTVEGFDSTYMYTDQLEEVILYQGVDTIDVIAGERNAVGISLQPVKPMIRISPRFKHVLPYDTFSVSVRLYDTARYTGIIYRVTYDPSIMQFDSASAGSDLDMAFLTFSSYPDTSQTFVTFTLSPKQAPPNGLFKTGRSGTLAKLYFTSYFPSGAIDSTMLAVSYLDLLRDSVGQTPNPWPILFSGGCLLTVGYDLTAAFDVTGRVLDALTGQPLANATVTITQSQERANRPNALGDSVLTDSQGEYHLTGIPEGNFEVIVSKAGYVTFYDYRTFRSSIRLAPIVLTQELPANRFRFVLSWGETPKDLDAYLWVEAAAATMLVYQGAQGDSLNAPFAHLDRDDLEYFGPETITIYSLYLPTKFAVRNWSLEAPLAGCGAHVDLYWGNIRYGSWDVPPAGTGEWWYVCDLAPGTTYPVLTYRNLITVTPPGPVPVFVSGKTQSATGGQAIRQ
ncbi:MAG: carboxypeptidase regulatory-like domain-containing protein [Candidatus Zixiibacteriota bacterium]